MKLKVLIVEDEELIRNEIHLTTPWDLFSCEVVGIAENGFEGETLFRELKPDIVITDIRMPGKDGIEMLQDIRPSAAIILTGHSDFDYARSAIKLGVRDYLLKPVDDEEFYASLKSISDSLIKMKSEITQFREYIQQPESGKQDYYINSAVNFINIHYASPISLGDVADHIGISESYLSRLFKSRTGYSYLVYLRNHRLRKALELMKDQGRRINEVARDTGFHDMSYFSSIFKKCVGMSPSQYQNGFDPDENQPFLEE